MNSQNSKNHNNFQYHYGNKSKYINLNNIYIDIKSKTKYEEGIKNIYSYIVDVEMQKSHPFGLAENRFSWVNIYSNGNDLKTHKKLINERKDNLEGGIGRYFSKNKIENQKELERNILRNSLDNNNNRKKMKYRFQNLNSQRVINPEKDTEIEKVSKKKTYENFKNNKLSNTNGKISSLFQKTPLIFRYRGKKILSNSVCYGRKGDINIFSETFLNDKQYNRIRGVMRKSSLHKINDYQKPSESLNYEKKHFKKIY